MLRDSAAHRRDRPDGPAGGTSLGDRPPLRGGFGGAGAGSSGLRRHRCRCGRRGRFRLRLRLRLRLLRLRLLLGRAALLDEVEDVLLRYATAAARTGDLRRVDVVLGRDPRHHGRDERVAAAAVRGRLGLRRGLRRGLPHEGCVRLLWRASERAPAAPRPPAHQHLRSANLGELRPDVDGLALLDENLRERARSRARHLGVDLVGRDLEQRLVRLDVLALLLEPARDRPLRDGHAHLRHHDIDCGLRSHPVLSNTPRGREDPSRRLRPEG